jgi:hypothetical protein
LPRTPNGLRYPGDPNSEPPNGPLQIGQLAQDVDSRIIGRFADAAAALAAYPTPVYGQVFHLATLGLHEWNGTELEPLTGCLKVAPSADQYNSGGSNPAGTVEQRITGGVNIPTGQHLFSGRLYWVGFSGRAWAGTVNEQGTLRIRVGKSTTLTTANTVVASHQFFTIPAGSNNADDAADVKFGGYFAVRDSGLYGVALFGKVSVGSFAVGKDDRGRYDLTLNKEGAAAPGLVTVI